MYEGVKKEFFLQSKLQLSLYSISITLKPEQIQAQVLCPLQAQKERAIDPREFTLSWSIKY